MLVAVGNATAPDPSPVDRRRLRTERGRDAVVEALLSLYDEGDPQPGAARIAERAGVSERSVFRYFDDLESLAAAAIERQSARVAPAFAPPDPTGDLDARIHALVDQRLGVHDAAAAVAHAGAILEPRSPTVARAFAFRRRYLRKQLAVQFADELAAATGTARSDLLDALDAVSCFEYLDYLRTVAGHSRSRTRAIATRTLHALLTATRGEITPILTQPFTAVAR